MPENVQTTADRIDGRKQAEQVIDLVVDIMRGRSPVFCEALRARLAESVAPKAEPVEPDPAGPMTDAEAIDWERGGMPFGAVGVLTISEVSVDYLVWLSGQLQREQECAR